MPGPARRSGRASRSLSPQTAPPVGLHTSSMLPTPWRGWLRAVPLVRHASTTPFYRPLPDPGVGWRADEVDEARRAARARHMRFSEEDAAELAQLQASLTELRHAQSARDAEQKRMAELIPRLAKSGAAPADLETHRHRARELRAELRALDKRVADAQARSLAVRSAWPNRMHADVPHGPESVSRVVTIRDARAEGFRAPLPTVDLPCTVAELAANEAMQAALPSDAQRDHIARAQALSHGTIDMISGITTTGPSWPYMLGTMALLEHALTQYALHVAVRHHFTPVCVPDVVKTDVAERCGFRPRDEAAAQTYFVDTQRDADAPALCLAGTAEIPLAALVAKNTYRVGDGTPNAGGDVTRHALPVKLVALGHAFRAEAGARGADTRGLYRIHQFTKAELFAVTTADASDAMLESLRRVQEEIVAGLGLLYRVLDMSSEELGASAYRKYDIEAWMPGRGAWGEICSASNCTDYQARRLAIKYKDGRQSHYAHTLNATAAAIPRLIVALLETYSGNKLVLPASLRPFWLGGAADPHVQWAELAPPSLPHAAPAPTPAGAATSPAPRDGARSDAPPPRSALARAQARLRALAPRTGADPAPLLVSFLLLHELTAIVPLVLLAVLLAVFGAGDALLRALHEAIARMWPAESSLLSDWVSRGRRMATRMCARCDALLPRESGAPGAAVWLTSLTAAYVAVKLLWPVRIAASLALAPATARLLQPLWRRLPGLRRRSVTP